MRRLIPALAALAALCTAASATSALTPVRRTFGETTLPRVRAGTIHVPAAHGSGRVRVIVALRLPPLAASGSRGFFGTTGARRLDVHSASSRAYLARVDAAQVAAIQRLRRAIPQARVQERFRIVLDAVTVSIPARRLPALARQSFAAKTYPSLQYALNLNRSPSIIGADVLHATTGARGQGIKIGIVDDGIDTTNPFLSPAGFSYPAGFPKGQTAYTTPKVIVAKAFPAPNTPAAAGLPLDRNASFHGTHVAGIAAGDSGTTATAGRDHPQVCCLEGVAPRAWLGNYRVFSLPTPIGNVANSPEIIQAFEAAVADGMDVINFSGGGPETDPANDALIPTMHNVAAAGVLPVVSAGNDRDDFGYGTVGSPGSAPDALTVAATSNLHVFGPSFGLTSAGAPSFLKQIPYSPGAEGEVPSAWLTSDQTLVDVTSIPGTNGQAVDGKLCGPELDPNGGANPLPAGSLSGAIALVSRGSCSFLSKADRAKAAGAIGLVVIDNRPGEANPIVIRLTVPAVMISDLDGSRLRSYLATTGGRATVRFTRDYQELVTGRSGIVTSFSSAGPTSFTHALKPDLAAPGGDILSSTLPEAAGSPFASFDGTSMSAPHATGAAALLRELHPTWTPAQLKSALVASAGPAWGNTARTQEASVLLEGGGLIDLPRANEPRLFTDPASLSFGYLNANHGAQSVTRLIHVSDAGEGAGTWQVTLAPQSASAGATLDLPALVTLAPGGATDLSVVARSTAGAAPGDDYGFVVLTNGDVTRRIPYCFIVERPALESASFAPLKTLQAGDTSRGTNLVSEYRYPTNPFGPPATYTGPSQFEDGAENLFQTTAGGGLVNLGVSVVLTESSSVVADPFFLGSPDENTVQGYAGIPSNVNALTFDFGFDVGAAGAQFPRPQTFYVSVDSPRDPFTKRLLAGGYLLRSWVNDLTPPTIRLLTTTVARGRPTLALRATDNGSGVDPLSLVIAYNRILLGAAVYDPISGIALFPIPSQAPRVTAKRTPAVLEAYDFQETKNVNTFGSNPLPNTAFKNVSLKIVSTPALTWLVPGANECVRGTVPLTVLASAPKKLKSVAFYDGKRRIATDRQGLVGLYSIQWRSGKATRGRHALRAVLSAGGRTTASAQRRVRVCR